MKNLIKVKADEIVLQFDALLQREYHVSIYVNTKEEKPSLGRMHHSIKNFIEKQCHIQASATALNDSEQEIFQSYFEIENNCHFQKMLKDYVLSFKDHNELNDSINRIVKRIALEQIKIDSAGRLLDCINIEAY